MNAPNMPRKHRLRTPNRTRSRKRWAARAAIRLHKMGKVGYTDITHAARELEQR